MRTVAIIQARMTSTRLPGKVLADLAGRPLLERVVERARQARLLDLVVVATTDRPTDDPIAQLCSRLGISCFRGSEDDVLDRYYQAARNFGADCVVRLTADCPLLDAAVIDRTVRAFLEGGHDYVSNVTPPTYPDGLDTEVFSMAALERAWREAHLKSERQHVTPYIHAHPELFRLANVAHERDLSALRWTVDNAADLEFVRAVYARLGPVSTFGLAAIVALLEQHPEIQEINAGQQRNEGYEKSLAEDALLEGRRDS